MADPVCGSHPFVTEISQARPGGKRKRPEVMEDKAENAEFQEHRPLKRVSPFLNTPKQRKEEKRHVLRLSYEKLRGINDPEKCLLRSVLVHNTAKKLQVELMQEGGYWAHTRFYTPMEYPVVSDMYRNRFMRRPKHLTCEYEVLNNSYLYLNPQLSSEVDDIACDELSKVLEHTMSKTETTAFSDALCLEKGHKECNKSSDVSSVQSHHTQTNTAPPTSRKTLNNTGASAEWDYRAYAANLTGAPIFRGSITMGIPMNKNDLKSSNASVSRPVAMETDSNKTVTNDTSEESDIVSDSLECNKDVTSSDQIALTDSDRDSTPVLTSPDQDLPETTVSQDCKTSSDDLSQDCDGSKPTRCNKGMKGYSYCHCGSEITRRSCCCHRLITSATTLASISQELDSFMTDYLSRTSLEPSHSLSCAYLSGENETKKSSSGLQSEGIESVLNNLVPVLGGI